MSNKINTLVGEFLLKMDKDGICSRCKSFGVKAFHGAEGFDPTPTYYVKTPGDIHCMKYTYPSDVFSRIKDNKCLYCNESLIGNESEGKMFEDKIDLDVEDVKKAKDNRICAVCESYCPPDDGCVCEKCWYDYVRLGGNFSTTARINILRRARVGGQKMKYEGVSGGPVETYQWFCPDCLKRGISGKYVEGSGIHIFTKRGRRNSIVDEEDIMPKLRAGRCLNCDREHDNKRVADNKQEHTQESDGVVLKTATHPDDEKPIWEMSYNELRIHLLHDRHKQTCAICGNNKNPHKYLCEDCLTARLEAPDQHILDYIRIVLKERHDKLADGLDAIPLGEARDEVAEEKEPESPVDETMEWAERFLFTDHSDGTVFDAKGYKEIKHWVREDRNGWIVAGYKYLSRDRDMSTDRRLWVTNAIISRLSPRCRIDFLPGGILEISASRDMWEADRLYWSDEQVEKRRRDAWGAENGYRTDGDVDAGAMSIEEKDGVAPIIDPTTGQHLVSYGVGTVGVAEEK